MKGAVWVVGRGLLGGAVVRAAVRRGVTVADIPPLPWGRPAELDATVAAGIRTLLDLDADNWSIVWAAGGSSVASGADATSRESAEFARVTAALAAQLMDSARPGTLFLASSVGAVYGGATDPPFTEATPPAPISPYGELKLAMEVTAADFARSTGTRVVIGRISNLYGPGQNLDKAQGLISTLLVSRFGGDPAQIYVPLQTVRDYLFVDDCAELVLDCLERASGEPSAMVVTKIFGSDQPVDISSLLAYLRYVSRALPAVTIGSRPSTRLQALDLRVRSEVWPELDRRERTPLAAGFHATMLDVLQQLQQRPRTRPAD
jgi:UDP-glucose 4-epimerase